METTTTAKRASNGPPPPRAAQEGEPTRALASESPPPPAALTRPVPREAIPEGVSPIVHLVAGGQFTIEQIRELMEAQREHDRELARRAYHEAMPRARAAMAPATRASLNTHFGTTYASLDDLIEAARGPLAEHGFNYAWTIEQREGEVRATCRMTHSSGHEESASVRMPVMPGLVSNEGKQVVNPAQALGVAITYAERYSFRALVGIATEDADGDPRNVAAACGAELPPPPPPPEVPMMSESEARTLSELLDRIDALDTGARQRVLDHYAPHCAAADNALGFALTVERFEKARTTAQRRLEELEELAAFVDAPPEDDAERWS